MSLIDAVVDLGYGDSGKGAMVEYLARNGKFFYNSILVVRTQGGHQVGHTVQLSHGNNRLIEYHNFGSATHHGIPTFYDKACTCCPFTFNSEFKELSSILQFDKVENPLVYYHPETMVTLRIDIMFNRWLENKRDGNRHGSVGLGFGQTIERNQTCKFFIQDLKCLEIYHQKIEAVYKWYKERYPEFVIDADWFACEYEDIDEFITNRLISISPFSTLYNKLNVGYIIFESNQGTLLDKDHGVFPHVTRSRCTIEPVFDFIVNNRIDSFNLGIWYVSRMYHTRHGAGPFSETQIQLKNNESESNHYNPNQHEFKTSPLNIPILQHALRINLNKVAEAPMMPWNITQSLVFTCLDQVDPDSIPIIQKNQYIKNVNVAEFSKSVFDGLGYPVDSETLYFSNSPLMKLHEIRPGNEMVDMDDMSYCVFSGFC